MSYFSSSANITRKGPFPTGLSPKDAVALLHDHEFLIRSDPEYSTHSEAADAEKPKPSIPDGISPIEDTKCYNVSGKATGLTQYTNLDDGVFVQSTFPAGVVLETLWRVETAQGGVELVYDSTVSCSKLILGTAKVNLKKFLDGIFEKIVGKLGDAQ